MARGVAVLGLLLLTSTVGRAQTAPVTSSQVPAVVGTYRAAGALKGTLVVAGDLGALLTPDHGTVRKGRASKTGDSWKLVLQGEHDGIIDRVGGASTSGTTEDLALQPQGDGFATRLDGKALLLERQRSVLVVEGGGEESDANTFANYARAVGDYYKKKGYARIDHIVGNPWDRTIDALDEAAKEGRPYSRLVFVGHGGWDGPISFVDMPENQGSPVLNPDLFDRIVRAIGAGTTRDADVWVSCCHAGGSNATERRVATNSKQIWVDEIAKRTGRTAGGPCGQTAVALSVQLVTALEGEGHPAQETRRSTPAGGRYLER
jgi:hypothetical protein